MWRLLFFCPNKKDTPKIEVTMKPDEESNYTPEEKATYPKIKEYVKVSKDQKEQNKQEL